MDSGQLPRPPRRVPGGDGSQTVIEGRSRAAEATTQATGGVRPRPPWRYGRFFGGLLAVLLILGIGGGAGWFARQRTVGLDEPAVLKSIGPGVVRVVATTCAGSGEASGVLISEDLVLTAASAVEQAVSTAVLTSDGRVRRANPLGSSADGVAVLRLLGGFGVTPAPLPLADRDPDPIAARGLIGYTAAGERTLRSVGSVRKPRALSEVMNAQKLGGAVVDRSGRLVGLVTGETVAASRIVPLDRLRDYAATGNPGITPAPESTCSDSRGPQGKVIPELAVGKTPLALEVQRLLSNYMTLSNRRDFTGIRQLYSRRYAIGMPLRKDSDGHRTSYFFNARLIEVGQVGEVVIARMTFTVLFSSNSPGSAGQNCNRLDHRYQLVREAGQLKLDRASTLRAAQSCDTD